MKTFYRLTIKNIIVFLIFVLTLAVNVFAQTPPYYNMTPPGSANSFPFAVTTGKGVQWLVAPSEFALPSPAPSGNNITNLWLYMVSTSGSATVTNLQIRLGQTSAVTLPTGVLYSGAMTVVYSQASAIINWSASGWINITLSTPFAYDPSQSLIVEVTQCGMTGTTSTINQTALSGFRRTYATPVACVQGYVGQDANLPGIGLTLVPAGPCTNPPTPGTVNSTVNPLPCASTSFSLSLVGGTGGAGQTYQWQSSPDNSFWTNIPGATGAGYTATQTVSTYYRCVVTCGTSVNSAGLLVTSLSSPLSGIKTIPGTYATIAAAISALNCGGVGAGGVTFNVAAGYTETVASLANYIITASGTPGNPIIFQKSGAGANPILLNTAAGVGTVTISSFGSNGDAFIKLSGTDYITFDGIDVSDDPYTGLTTGPKIEYGYMLCRGSATDGCKNVTIKNCHMVGDPTNVTCVSAGVYVANYTSGGVLTNATSIAGRHENIFIDGNTVENMITGLYIDGTIDAVAPYNLYTNNVQIGVNAGNTLICGSRATTNAVTQYGIYTIYNDSMKIMNNIIRCNTGNNTPTTYGIFTSTGTNSSIDIINNNVSDSLMYTTGSTSTQQAGIYNSFGATGTNNVINIQNNVVHDCAYPTAAAPSIFYIANVGGPQTINITGNTVTNNYQGGGALGTATGTQYGIYNSATINLNPGSTYTIANNNINNSIRTQSAVGIGTTYGIYLSAGCITTNVNNNNVNTITLNTTTGTFGGIYCLPTITGGTLNIYNNTVNAITRNLNLTSGVTYCMYASQSSLNTNVYGNTVSNINLTAPTATSNTTYGYYNFGSSNGTENFYNNNIFNITQTATATGLTYGAYVASGASAPFPVKQVYGNNIYNITGSTGQTGALYINYAAPGNIYKNHIYNISSTGITGAPQTYAMLLNNSNPASVWNVYNNLVHEIKAPLGNPAAAPYLSLMGIWVNGGAQANIYYNSVYLDGVSTGVNWGSTCLWCSVTPIQDMRNNILINKSTPTGAGFNAAFVRNGSGSATYSTLSDRNNFYSGAPGPTRLIYYDYLNSVQTLAAYQTLMGAPKDVNSVTENTGFVNTAVSPYDLHLTSCSFSQCESNAGVVSSPISITDDYDGNPRYSNAGFPFCASFTPVAPDIGADEWDGRYLDLAPPVISYTALANTNSTSNRSFTNVTATDVSGINVAAGTKPRCYFKKSTDLNDLTGWKYVEANGSSSPFDFTINYALLNSGSVVIGDVVQYFVVVQDLAAAPNVAINSGIFASTPSSVALTGAQFPITGTINQYNISATYSGNYRVGVGQPYPSLTAAGGLFQALNAGVITGNITAQVTSDITIEDGTNMLNNPSYDIPGANYQIKIVPQNATLKTLSGSVAGAMIPLNGAKFLRIDGDNGFGNKYLTFRNTSGTGPTFLFQNDARQVTVTNCTIESNNAAGLGTSATIVIGGTTGTTGNDSISILNCDIRDRSDAVGFPSVAVYATGNVAAPNDYMVIQGCNIYNTFNAAATFCDLYLIDGNANMTIQGNSFFQTATRSPSNAAAYFAMIMATSGNNNVLSGNYLGGTAPLCGGTPMTFTDCAGMLGFRVFTTGISSPTTVSNNTIANMDIGYTGVGSAFLFRAFDINGNIQGYVNCTNNTIGSLFTNDNIIIRFNPATSAGVPSPCAIGFGQNNGTLGYPIGSVTNNTIGGITYTGTGTNTGTTTTFAGIWVGATVNTAVNITGNTIGGPFANSINNTMTVTTNNLTMNGIYSLAVTNASGMNISNNTVQNITNSSIGSTASYVRGIYHAGTSGFTANNNSIHDFNCATTQAGATSNPQVVGIMTSSSALNQTMNLNTIFNLNAITSGLFSPYVAGTCLTSSTATATISRNRIYNLTNTATGSPIIFGIDNYWGAIASICSNNQITLTNGEPTDLEIGRRSELFDNKESMDKSSTMIKQTTPTVTTQSVNQQNVNLQNENLQTVNNVPPPVKTPIVNNNGNNPKNKSKVNPAVYEGEIQVPVVQDNPKKHNEQLSDLSLNGATIYGIYDDATTAAWSYYYNSVYVGGQATVGALTSFCLRKTAYANNITDNIFFNARTNGGTATGSHYALTSTGIPSALTNYNVYVTFNPATLAQYNAVDQTIALWRTSTGRDKETWSTTSSVINASNLFTSIASGNLNIQSGNSEAWLVSGKGIAIAGQNIDYSGNTRVTAVNAGCTDIGSNEFAAIPPGNPVASQDFAPGSGVTSTYSLWGRNIAQIFWYTGGTSYPTSMTVNYYTGQNPANTLGGNFSNSHTSITPVGTFSGGYADITYYFGDNETYTITTPASNTVLSKYNPTSWEVFHLGGGIWQSQLTFNAATQTYSDKVLGLTSFSDFALTDETSPLPVDLASFNALVTNRDIKINWTTSHEINNQGFDIERRMQTDIKTNTYSSWISLTNITGHGTTNEAHTYSYTDRRLTTGKYQYRLKQTDFNNNIEYFTLHSPDIVEIGKPMNSDISQNYPNPSNPKSKIDYQIPFNGKVSLKVYDIIGREVVTIVEEIKEAGFYTAEFDGTNLASGVYFYRILAEGEGQKYVNTKKMILVK